MGGSQSNGYSTLLIDDKTAGKLSAAEIELIRADEAVSCSPVQAATRRQLLRVEALMSVHVDGFAIPYSDVAMVDLALLNDMLIDETPLSVYRFAKKQRMADCLGVAVACSYIRAVNWVAASIKPGCTVDENVMEKVRSLYDEEQIEKLARASDDLDGLLAESSHEDGWDICNRTRADAEAMRHYLSFVSSDVLSPSAQAEVSHALMQLMRPFGGKLDGMERLFTHIIFYRRGVLTRSVAPLAVGPGVSVQRHVESIASNMSLFSQVVANKIAVNADFSHCAFSTKIAAQVMQLCDKTMRELYELRCHAKERGKKAFASDLLYITFLEYPFLTVNAASKIIGKKFSATNDAMLALLEEGVIAEELRLGKTRVFSMPAVVDFYERLLKKLSSTDSPDRDDLLKEFYPWD